ncbi:TPA: hypothetical protein KNK42_003807 [Clostridioides difficile]|uniref:Uncharacterized protein n=4 Tax=root TaxID=1 RepID=A0A0A8WJV6_9CAUD|nr:hypothetical protein [Clostridioides difficile]YP_001110733.1 hypothetical protein phiC2p15 [Clostridioides phage phiC2]YP_009206134.1 hypothetical protein PHIMMP01_20016 [Clostridium phage phiMMP01]YP_009214196.1 hypothetical protein PHIMMP03_20016 [Clostridium phage phiMMP03]EQI44113.1 hypothetical protein QOS_0665 [Clostridioides difficile Y184]MCC0644697.1 hypothetical protein [Clostridioides sp. ZZV14-6150]MCC0722645.1 hypothetical protein [Clostridioides sp. ZZV14-6104]DAN94451.1 MA
MIKIKDKYEIKDSISFDYSNKRPLEERVSEMYKKAGKYLIDISDKLATDTIDGSSLKPIIIKFEINEAGVATIEKQTKYLVMEVE